MFLEFPKHYYFYQMKCVMSNNPINGKIRKQLKRPNKLTRIVCDSLDQDFGFCFIENVFYDGKSKFLFNVICHEEIDFKISRKQRKNMVSNLLQHFKIEIKSFEFTYISHECVDLVSCKELLFGCLLCGCCTSLSCCNNVEFIQESNRRRTTVSRHESKEKTNEQELARAIAMEIGDKQKGSSNIIMLGVDTDINKEEENYNADDSTHNEILYEASTNQDDTYWVSWSQQQVSQWIDSILSRNMTEILDSV